MITVYFGGFFALTVALLGLASYFGFKARRRIHLPLVALTLSSLVVTILFAKELGTHYDLETAGSITPAHMLIARLAAASYLLPLGTGLATLLGAKRIRPWHRRAAFVAAGLTILAAATGVAMVLMAQPID